MWEEAIYISLCSGFHALTLRNPLSRQQTQPSPNTAPNMILDQGFRIITEQFPSAGNPLCPTYGHDVGLVLGTFTRKQYVSLKSQYLEHSHRLNINCHVYCIQHQRGEVWADKTKLTRNLLLNCLYQTRKVSGHVYEHEG